MIPVIGFSGWGGSGKTTLLERLIPLLRDQGHRVGVIKHHGHEEQEEDPSGIGMKDTDRYLSAGAKAVSLIQRDMVFEDGLSDLAKEKVDLILFEGFKYLPQPRFFVERSGIITTSVMPKECLGIISDDIGGNDRHKIWFHRDDIQGIADYLERLLKGEQLHGQYHIKR